MSSDFAAVAIISAYNEADIIGAVVQHLIAEGLSVYVLDHGSTDGTVQAVERFLGRGLLAIEPFPGQRFPDSRDKFSWTDILERKRELSIELDADWFIHHDADEFRESPWEHVRLLDAIHRVDRFGYNAIDFQLYNFWPTDESFQPGTDPRTTLRFCEPGRTWDKTQIKCWKKQATPPDLVTSGGHDVSFPGRRVFPLRFVLRHYPIRTTAQGSRKIFVERLPRFFSEELARGWHVQYKEFREGGSLIRASDTLVEYDGDAVRLRIILGHRDMEKAEASLNDVLEAKGAAMTAMQADIDRLHEVLSRRTAERDRSAADVSALTREINGANNEIAARQRELEARQTLLTRLLADIESQRADLSALYASRSWRWTSVFRAAQRFLRRWGQA